MPNSTWGRAFVPLASGRDSLVLAGLFLRRGRVVTRVLAVAAGAAVAAALCGIVLISVHA